MAAGGERVDIVYASPPLLTLPSFPTPSYAVGYETSEFMGTRGWVWTFQAETIPALAILFGMAYLPGQSARQLIHWGYSVSYNVDPDSNSYPNPTPHPP